MKKIFEKIKDILGNTKVFWYMIIGAWGVILILMLVVWMSPRTIGFGQTNTPAKNSEITVDSNDADLVIDEEELAKVSGNTYTKDYGNVCGLTNMDLNVKFDIPPVTYPIPDKIDVFFVIDITSSMSSAIASAKSAGTEIMNNLKTKYTDMRFGVGWVGDDATTISNAYGVSRKITSNVTAVQNNINSYAARTQAEEVAAGNYDYPEAYNTALYYFANPGDVGWRSGSKRLIILLADAMYKTSDSVNGMTPSQAVQNMNANDVGLGYYLFSTSSVIKDAWNLTYINNLDTSSTIEMSTADITNFVTTVYTIVNNMVIKIGTLKVGTDPSSRINLITQTPKKDTVLSTTATTHVDYPIKIRNPNDGQSYSFDVFGVGDGIVYDTYKVRFDTSCAPTTYTLTVNAGTGGTVAIQGVTGNSTTGNVGNQKTIIATPNTAAGYTFDKWTTTSGPIGNVNNASTTFTFTASNATVTASFKLSTPACLIGGGAKAVAGYAWSDNIGWVSMTGVSIDSATGKLSGYAWSDNLGWIRFDPPAPYPANPQYSAKLDSITGSTTTVSGWAQIDNLKNSPNTGGWINMKDMAGTAYSVNVNLGTGLFSGYAWNDQIGWFDFSHVVIAACANVCTNGATNYSQCDNFCGNGACDHGETNATCAQDCPVCNNNNICESPGETNANCPGDCKCDNDLTCDTANGEDSTNCPGDCPIVGEEEIAWIHAGVKNISDPNKFSTVKKGDTVEYTLTIKNETGKPGSVEFILPTLPAGIGSFTFVPLSASIPYASLSADKRTIRWENVDQSVTKITFRALAP